MYTGAIPSLLISEKYQDVGTILFLHGKHRTFTGPFARQIRKADLSANMAKIILRPLRYANVCNAFGVLIAALDVAILIELQRVC